jgi:hypothetical protein
VAPPVAHSLQSKPVGALRVQPHVVIRGEENVHERFLYYCSVRERFTNLVEQSNYKETMDRRVTAADFDDKLKVTY